MREFIKGTKWQVVEKVDPKTLKIANEYYYDGTPAYKIKLESNLAKKYAGWMLIEKDIRNIKSWLEIMLKVMAEIYGKTLPKISQMRRPGNQEKYNLLKALLVSIVTVYGKMFTQAEGRRVKLEKDMFKSDTQKLENHEDLMSLRHNFAAHSGNTKEEYANICLLLDSDRSRNTFPTVVRELFQPDAHHPDEIKKYISLLEFLQNYVDEKIIQLHRKVLEGALSKGIDYCYNFVEREA